MFLTTNYGVNKKQLSGKSICGQYIHLGDKDDTVMPQYNAVCQIDINLSSAQRVITTKQALFGPGMI